MIIVIIAVSTPPGDPKISHFLVTEKVGRDGPSLTRFLLDVKPPQI